VLFDNSLTIGLWIMQISLANKHAHAESSIMNGSSPLFYHLLNYHCINRKCTDILFTVVGIKSHE